MSKNCLFIIKTVIPGSSMMQQTETYEETQVHPTNAKTLNEFCQRLPLCLEKYSNAEDFDKKIQETIDTLQIQNFAFLDLFQGYKRTHMTIVPPKFD